MNLATQYLKSVGETVNDWDGICGELARTIATKKNDSLIYVEGDTGWSYHMAMMRNGKVHDAWCDAGALPLHDWLVEMFGRHAWIDLTIDGDDVWSGHVRDFTLEAIAA